MSRMDSLSVFVAAATVRTMAETCALSLFANGTKIDGNSTQLSLGRENTIECLYFEHAVKTARESGSGMATGRRAYEPIIIRKRIDKATPLIAKALCDNEVIEGVFNFYRPNPVGDGTTQQFYTIEIKQGRVAFFKQISPDSFNPALSNSPEIEEVGFVFHTITWTYNDGGITHQDTWDQQR